MLEKVLIGEEYKEELLKQIKSARFAISIAMYDWRWYINEPEHPIQEINRALVEAVRKGVQVRALLNKKDLIETLESVGIEARTPADKRTMHAKLVIIDEEKVLVGSHNMTRNAITHNLEASVLVRTERGNNRFLAFFNILFGL